MKNKEILRKDIFGKLLCTWHNFSAFSKSNDKIEIAAKALAKDKNAWDHIFGALPTGHANVNEITGAVTDITFVFLLQKNGIWTMS